MPRINSAVKMAEEVKKEPMKHEHPPSQQQQAVIDFVKKEKGSLNLVARAGCGKTSTIEMAVKEIVADRLGQAVVLAYNKAIANELKFRLQRNNIDWKQAEAGTVHSFGFRSWKKVAPNVVVDGKKVYNLCFKTKNPFHERNALAISRLVSLAKQTGLGFLHGVTDQSLWFELVEHFDADDELVDGDSRDQLVQEAIKIIQLSFEQDRETIDYDDMVLAPLVHNSPCWQYDFVFVDEAQDTNPTRRALAKKLMKPKTGRLVAVGDPRQAIYGFTGADATAMDIIQSELGSKVLPLTVTYRCPKVIVKEANFLVPDLRAHESAPKGIVREIDQYDKDGKAWFKSESLDPKDSIILCRNTKPLVQMAYQMLKASIGCRIEGREIGEGLIGLAMRWKRVSNISVLSDVLREYEAKEKRKWMAKGKEGKAQDIEDRVGTLQVLIERCIMMNKHEVYDLVSSIRELFGDTPPGQTQNVVTLCTIHKSKGREWSKVYLYDKENTLPSKYARKEWQLVQEANLEYVAITRSKQELIYIKTGRSK